MIQTTNLLLYSTLFFVIIAISSASFAGSTASSCKLHYDGCSKPSCLSENERAKKECMISGYPSEYACHDHYSTCQKIGDQCVLTPTDKLQDCVNNFSQYMPILQKIEHDKFVSENRGKQCSIVGSYGTACVGAVDAVGKENTDFDTDHNPNDRTFECYFLSTCSIQANKSCGWSSNTEFSKCLKDPGSFLDEYYKKHPTKEFNP